MEAFRVSLQMLGDLTGFGISYFGFGDTRVQLDDSIVQDTAAEKAQDMAEVGLTMGVWEFRQKWYGEDEATARRMADELAPEG